VKKRLPQGRNDREFPWLSSTWEPCISASLGRKQVPEDGRDVCDTESDSENEEHGEELTGCYVDIPVDEHGNPLSAAYKLSSEQAAALRWSASTSSVFSGATIEASAADPGMSTTHSLPSREGKLTLMSPGCEAPVPEDSKSPQKSAKKSTQRS
jgi:hypothetical protein